MDSLCFATNLTSSELASWVQAIGSIAAIIGALWVATWQSKKQHESAVNVMRAEQNILRVELGRSLLTVSLNSKRLLEHLLKELPDREAFHQFQDGAEPFALKELRIIEDYLISFPLHNLPYTLVSSAMLVRSTIRQFKEKIEEALQHHRKMNAQQFDAFFVTSNEMITAISRDCDDLLKEVKALDSSK